jgi:hypothetical protein
MMVAMGTVVVTGMVVADCGLSHHAFLGDLGHGWGQVVVLDALPLIL